MSIGDPSIRMDFRALTDARGYVLLYRHQESNRCPGCGGAHWHVGRIMAECAGCGTAIPLVAQVSTLNFIATTEG